MLGRMVKGTSLRKGHLTRDLNKEREQACRTQRRYYSSKRKGPEVCLLVHLKNSEKGSVCLECASLYQA